MSAITLNGTRVVSLRVVHPWRGVPFIDVDLDPDLVQTAPSVGPATIIIGDSPPILTMLGFIDTLAAGTFVATARVRVLAGKGGWSQSVPAQHFHVPGGGLVSTAVYNATAAMVLEQVVDLQPRTLGTDYARSHGRASRIFDGVDWWVDLVTGVTTVGPRPPAVPDPSLEILSFDPLTQTAELTCDTLILPGTVLTDPTRLGTQSLIVRSVEQVFDASGSHAKAFCSSNTVERLHAALRTMVQEFGETAGTRMYRYRFVSVSPEGPNLVALQAVDRDPLTGGAAVMPDLVPCPQWTGMAGVTAMLPPSLEVLVQFPDGDPTQPRIVGYSTLALPLEVTVDAITAAHIAPTAAKVDIGASAVAVAIAGGADALVLNIPYQAMLTVLETFAGQAAAASTAAQIATAAGTMLGSLANLPPAKTLLTKAT